MLILLLLLSGLYWTWSKGYLGGESRTDQLFGVEDTAGVNKIYMVNKLGEAVTIENIRGLWMVNGKYQASNAWLNQMFKTIMRLQVKGPVSGVAWNTVIRQLAQKHVKVEIYKNGDKIRSFFVGGGTPNGKGTYMMVEEGKKPYICEVAGFEGEVSHHFPTDLNMWRSKKMLHFEPERIEEIRMEWPKDMSENFVANQKNGKYFVTSFQGISVPQDSLLVASYFSRFRNVSAEALLHHRTIEMLDSLEKTAKPFCILTIIPKGYPETKVRFYSKASDVKTKTTFNPDGSQIMQDPDRYLAVVQGVDDIYLVQDFVFGNKLLKLSDFRKFSGK